MKACLNEWKKSEHSLDRLAKFALAIIIVAVVYSFYTS